MKTVLITGCSSGFGRAMVTAFLADGWRVVATMRRAEERRDLFEDELAAHGDRLLLWELDVTSKRDRKRAVKGLAETGLDALVNNAGRALFGSLESTTEAQIRGEMEVNWFGPVLLTRALLPLLRASKGTVVNISSVMGFQTMPLMTAYCSSKHAMSGFSDCLAMELEPHGVRVHCVEPGNFGTQFQANIEWGAEPDDAYATQRARALRLFTTFPSPPGSTPAAMARLVVGVASGKGVGLRTRAGIDAKAAGMLRALPELVRSTVLRWGTRVSLRLA